MNKQMMIVGAIVVVAIAAGAFFLMSSKKDAGDSMMADETMSSGSAMSKGSIKSLLGAGKNVTCEIVYPENGGTGTVYVSGEKMRGDFMMSVNGKSMDGHMISDGEYMYSWQGTTGMKFKADAVATPSPATGQTSQQQSVDINEEVDMKCGNWSVDSSKFTPPSDVTFTDATQMMESMQEQTQTGGAPKMDSSMCASISDPQAKAACLGAVGQ